MNCRYDKQIAFFSVNLLISFLAYLVLISNELTNTYDGMWKGTYYVEYDWPLQIGRWFWKYVGIMRGSISPEPFTSLMSLTLFTLAGCMIVSMFHIFERPIIATIFVQGITINEAVCIALSYRYMSPTFAFSFFSSISAVYLISKLTNKWLAVILSTISITLMLGTYQANLGSTLQLVLLYFLMICYSNEELKEGLLFIARSALSVILGCIAYKIIWELLLKHYGISAADYKSAGDISIKSIVTNLPKQAIFCYKTFIKYFTSNLNMKNNFFQESSLYVISYIVLSISLVVAIGKKHLQNKDWIRLCVFLITYSVIPIAVGAVLLLTSPGTDLSLQMTMPYAIHCPCILAVLISCLSDSKDIRLTKLSTMLAVGCSIFLLYGSFLMVSLDQHVMLSSRNNTYALMNRVIFDLESQNGALSTSETRYIFIGKPSDNQEYRKDETWQMANDYAQYGDFALVSNCNTQSYAGLFRDLGIYIPYCDANTWHTYETYESVQNMPTYPNEGYVQLIDGNYVVKIS